MNRPPTTRGNGVGRPGYDRGELEIQGRSVRALRYETLGGFSQVEELGPGIRVDVSREGRCLAVQLSRIGTKEPLSDDEVRAFFAHFDVWRDG